MPRAKPCQLQQSFWTVLKKRTYSNDRGEFQLANLGTGSQIYLYLNNAFVDAKGSIVDYRSFLVQGYWGGKRPGDQLPFEYDPAAK